MNKASSQKTQYNSKKYNNNHRYIMHQPRHNCIKFLLKGMLRNKRRILDKSDFTQLLIQDSLFSYDIWTITNANR